MRFYILFDSDGSALGCELTLKNAKSLASQYGAEGMYINSIETAINAETVRRLLGDLGGYAKDSKLVWQSNEVAS